MRGYEQGKPIYFATPPVQLICALCTSLKEITARPIEERWAKHKQASLDIKKFVTDELGLKQVILTLLLLKSFLSLTSGPT